LRLLVTGAKGFTGEHFVTAARREGYEVIESLADLKDKKMLQQEVAEAAPEMVVHLAAISFVGHTETNAFYEVNTLGTLNLLDALVALAKPPQRVLLASSANIYGNCEQSPISEKQPPAPVNHYAISKLAMEYMAWAYLNRLPLFCVRPFNYTGSGQVNSFVIPKIVDHYARRTAVIELGNLNVEREFNDVRFVCEAYLRLLTQADPGEVYNVCSGHPVALKSVLQLMTEITGHHLQVQVNPAFVRLNDIQKLCGSPEKLINVIGQIPQPTLRETLHWMHECAVGVECV
jgi:nucleoside-diphosphate-sugar epimerase